MTLIKVYNLTTGHVEVIKGIDDPSPAREVAMARDFIDREVQQDHGSSTVYYYSRQEWAA